MGIPAATDLDALFDAIVASISARFPDLITVQDHIEDRTQISMPACLIEMADCDTSDVVDPGSEQLELVATFEARIIIGFRTDTAKREIRKLATALAAHIRLQRWGVPCGEAQVIAVEPDAFDPDMDRYEVYRVEWRQPIIIGESIWNNDGIIPTTVLASDAPDIGPPHAEDYDVITQAPQ
ncbi:MAG: hypothetical protein PF501_19075 [Salinisphaera sp.]|jgi:hypothetical protein|nr:hypothetical protein [Salinisphaera sp.]